MTTKKKPKACRVLSRKAPTRPVYAVATMFPDAMPRVRAPKGMAASVPLPDHHEWPQYGEECWRQAYDEARAWNALVRAAELWVYAQGSGYMPQSQKDVFFAAYVQAKDNYRVCWQVMEDCLFGVVA